jgi:hypothetical protein
MYTVTGFSDLQNAAINRHQIFNTWLGRPL